MASMGSVSKRLANALGATVLALHDRLVEAGVATLPRPADHPSAAASLALLGWVPMMPQSRLAYCLGLSQPATVRLVDRLEASGLLRRQRRRPGRETWVESTPDGRELARQFGLRRRRVMADVLESLPAADQKALVALLEKLAAALLQSKQHVMRICRLCDARDCGRDEDCPMWRAARVLD